MFPATHPENIRSILHHILGSMGVTNEVLNAQFFSGGHCVPIIFFSFFAVPHLNTKTIRLLRIVHIICQSTACSEDIIRRSVQDSFDAVCLINTNIPSRAFGSMPSSSPLTLGVIKVYFQSFAC